MKGVKAKIDLTSLVNENKNRNVNSQALNEDMIKSLPFSVDEIKEAVGKIPKNGYKNHSLNFEGACIRNKPSVEKPYSVDSAHVGGTWVKTSDKKFITLGSYGMGKLREYLE